MGKENWFLADPDGLKKIIERKGKGFIIFELIQNAWDQYVSLVSVNLHKPPGSHMVTLEVEDDDPDGFADLVHAYTVFGESTKKQDPKKRGIFDLGEKLVIALCHEAKIESTSGTIIFDPKKGRFKSRHCREIGSKFTGKLKMSRDEMAEAERLSKTLIPPDGIITTFNGKILPQRLPLHEFSATLPTQFGDSEGYIHKTRRMAPVQVHEVLPGEEAHIYEMGIPVVASGDKWHVNVGQKLPQSLERDGLPPSFVQELRVVVLNEMHDQISEEEANSEWVRSAASDSRCSDGAINTVVTQRYGEDRVGYDPSDPEANMTATSKGSCVIPARGMSKGEWSNAKRAGVIIPAGKKFPTPKPYGTSGPPVDTVPESKWTENMKGTVEYLKQMHLALIKTGVPLSVTVVNTTNDFSAAYSKYELDLNIRKLGKRWFDLRNNQIDIDALMIHEFAHFYCGNHLDHKFHDACCKLGARLKQIALESK